MEKTIEVTALCFADVVMVGYQDITEPLKAGDAVGTPPTPTRYWFAHMRGGASYVITERQAKDATYFLDQHNAKGTS